MEGESTGRKIASWLWAFVPLYTFGLGTVPVMIWAAVHKRHAVQAIFAAIYTIALIAVIAVVVSPGEEISAAQSAAFAVGGLVIWVGGLGHALGIRRWAFDLTKATPARPLTGPPPMPMPMQSELRARQQAAMAAAMDERQAREFARDVARNDPPQAYRLQIGRVDIPNRAFPDGGLVDVNNVSADALAAATGLPAPIVERIATVRQESGGFSSLEELCALTQLPPQTFDHLADRLYFPGLLPT